MKFENTRVYNFEGALRGMRNPMNSWDKSDSYFGICFNDPEEILRLTKDNPYEIIYKKGDYCEFASIGPKDMQLAQKLIKGGSEHRKFLRQIFVSVDITAPVYWWKEADTYKVSTTANSTSTMHKLAATPITLDCFEIGDYSPDLQLIDPINIDIRIENFINDLEQIRRKYLETGDTRYWKELVRWLPMGWMQKRTWTGNYENLLSMYHQRENHKLPEWRIDFCNWIESLPYANELINLK